jgi:hypothetical protein
MSRVVTMEEVVEALRAEYRRRCAENADGSSWSGFHFAASFLERSNLGREAIEVKLTRNADNENACSCRQSGSWEASRACGHVVGEPALLVIGEEGET